MRQQRPVVDPSLDEAEGQHPDEDYHAFVARAREHHARTGEWLPDPLLDEIDEARRRIMARHGNDYRKVLQWYVDLDKQHARQNGNGANPGKQHPQP